MMKRFQKSYILKYVLIVFCSLGLIACNPTTDVEHVKETMSQSDYYSQDDIKDAMNVVIEEFKESFDGGELKELCYDEKESLLQQESRQKEDNIDEVIVIRSNFKTGKYKGEGASPYNEKSNYTNYQWILGRNKTEKWEIIGSGY